VLVAVVEVDAEVVLAGLVPGQRVPLGVGPEPPRPQVGAEPGAAVDHLGEGQPPIPPDQALAVGVLRGDRVEDVGQVELRGGHHHPPRAAQDTRPDGVSETLAPAAERRLGATGPGRDGAPPTSRPAGPRWTWWSAGPERQRLPPTGCFRNWPAPRPIQPIRPSHAPMAGERSYASARTSGGLTNIVMRCQMAKTPHAAATMIGRLGTSLSAFSAGSRRMARIATATTSNPRMRPRLV